ncbi:hypothetical protein AHF37_00519 [Paragonimus kellicotti]|nr:hypothetical protein AHF37_00519 [Paragonimus kellicotti]
MQWAYLSFRLWIGFWVALFLLIMVALDLSALVKYITRFTEESFAALIAFIFIIEAFKKIFAISKYYPVDLSWTPEAVPRHNCSCLTPMNLTDSDVLAVMYDQHPLSDVPLMIKNGTSVRYSGSDMDIVNFTSMRIDWESISAGRYSWDSLQYRTLCTDLNGTWTGGSCAPFYVPDVFFFSCILFIVTFSLATGLKSMRTSPFFPARARAFIADFSVVIAITLTTLTDFFVSLHTPKLQVPAEFAPTLGYKKRGWIIHPFETNPWWTSLVALGPALVATILIFMDQQITAVIINRQENKLKKGAGYHLDLLVVAVTIAINSVLGIPWFVAATVLSINHLLSLKKESEVSAPGERPVYLGCREQRVTAFLIFLMIGLSVFMTRLLSCIPMAVLYGIFLFMGISSLHGVQMVERIGLMFMPIKYQPDYSFLRHVSLRRVHMYTVVQVTCFIMLWVIKSVEVVSILFPIMVLAMCFIRKGLDFIFTQDELKWLDEILPGTRTKRNSRNVYRVTSSGEMLTKDGKLMIGSGLHLEPKEKRINITEEVSKTTIWRQLSGADRINITEEVSKTTIWRQLSGADVKDGAHVPPKYKAKDSKKRHHRRKAPKTVDSHSGEHRVLVQNEQPAEEVNKPVLFCIDPKEQEQHSKSPWNIGDVEEEYGDEGGQSAKAQRSLPAPLITINPPSVHDSLEAMRRQPMV